MPVNMHRPNCFAFFDLFSSGASAAGSWRRQQVPAPFPTSSGVEILVVTHSLI
jgi:hypothetical protein